MSAAAKRDSERRAVMLSGLLAGLADVPEELDRPVAGLCADSREVKPGDLFCAHQGGTRHGLDYVEQALEAGASAVVWEPTPTLTGLPPARSPSNAVFIAIHGLSQQIGVIADRFYGHPSEDLRVIGFTGTDGKTSCTQLLAAAMDSQRSRCGVLGTLGYGLPGALEPASHTTPAAIRLQRLLARLRDQGAAAVAMEVSSHALDQGRVSGVRFDTAVLTNLTSDHLDYHGDLRAYIEAKRRLFRTPGLRAAVTNLDDPLGRELIGELSAVDQRACYGMHPLQPPRGVAVMGARKVQPHKHGLKIEIDGDWGASVLESPLLGVFNAYNLLAVLTVLVLGGMPLDEACARLSQVPAVPGRMERFGGGGLPTVVVDYAHTTVALGSALQALRAHCEGQLWVVFGCGGDRDASKRPAMGQCAESLADQVVITSDNPRSENPDAIIEQIVAGMRSPERARIQPDRGRAIQWAIDRADPADIVLVAGKGHEECQWVGQQCLSFSDREQVTRLLAGRRP